MNTKFDYIDSDEQLIAFSRQISSAKWIAVDTEFMRERTYYAQLALIQIASEHSFALIDVPAVRSLEPLLEVFTRRDCLKIMHSASQDMEVLGQALGEMPHPLFDTQIAASFLGEAEQIAYGAIVRQRLGIELEKDQTRTNWLQRPLSRAQLGYAEADVLYLRALYEQLVGELELAGRLEWVGDESLSLAQKTRLAADPSLAWQRLKSLSRLTPEQQSIARDLAQWREQRAQDKNLPREWVLKKQVLTAIAKIQPASLNQLGAIEGLNPRLIQQIGRQLLTVIKQAGVQLASQVFSEELNPEQRATAKKIMARLRDIGSTEKIAPSLIANRDAIERLVQGEQNLPLLSGWRADVAGTELQSMCKR